MSLSRKIKRLHNASASDLNQTVIAEASIILSKWDVFCPINMEFYNLFSKEAWAVACQMQGIYQIITNELVDFIGHLIHNQKAIEICCGVGTLGRALKIPCIDRKVHEDPRASHYFNLHSAVGAKCNIYYPNDVIEMTANAAFKFYQPEWVIGAWVTQKLVKGKIGMMFGPMEEEFVKNANYIHIGTGHLDIHMKKRINKLPHYIVDANWLINKSSEKSDSLMRIWAKDKIDFDSFPEHLEFNYELK